jgi:hypothetical protein
VGKSGGQQALCTAAYCYPPTIQTKLMEKQMKINGLKVADARGSVSLHITPQDIAKGNTKDPGGCAAARCIMREVPECVEARVHLGRTYIKTKDKWLRYQTPESLRSEIIAFDRGGQFEPGVYVLRPMAPANRLGKQQGSKKNQTNPKRERNTRKRRVNHTVTGVRQQGANR